MRAELSWVILQLLDYVEPGGPSEAAGLPRYACQDLFDVNVDASEAHATVLFGTNNALGFVKCNKHKDLHLSVKMRTGLAVDTNSRL